MRVSVINKILKLFIANVIFFALLVTPTKIGANDVSKYGGDVSFAYTVEKSTPVEIVNRKIPQTGLYEQQINPAWMFLASLVILLILLVLYRQKLKEESDDSIKTV